MNIRLIARFLSLAAIAAVMITGLGPAKWQPRTSLGWELDHVFGYFVITLLVCLAWPRPFIVGPTLMIFAIALEALQNLTVDRSPNLWAALYGAAGALAAACIAEILMRANTRYERRTSSD